ncbi:hypothetical protein [Streptomyces sp. NPDC059009]|uniref:hypothetical protein n=1 Tax=Streptomyces sp. NPDC059009 TaxID=3346694 RepID=UPI0036C0545C
MRVLIELHHRGDEAYGRVRVEGAARPVPFSSWLDLLRLLERPAPPRSAAGAEPDEGSDPGAAD